MASSFNLVVLVGHLCADPELRYTPKGTALAKFTLGVNRNWQSSEGEQKTEASFIDCDAWGRMAETISQYFHKGNPILVRGHLRQNSWEDKQTKEKRSKLVVVVDEFQFVEAKEKKANEPTDDLTPQPPRTELPPEEDDVPF